MKAFRLIVNTSPVGTYPSVDEAPALPYQHLSEAHLLYELIYNPAETKFMAEGRKMGATAINGLSMLNIQAEESWKIWNGKA